MATLIAIVYDKEQTGFDALNKLAELSKLQLITLADAAVATKDKKGKVKIKQTLENQVAERTKELEKSKKILEEKVDELERFNKLAVGREQRAEPNDAETRRYGDAAIQITKLTIQKFLKLQVI